MSSVIKADEPGHEAIRPFEIPEGPPVALRPVSSAEPAAGFIPTLLLTETQDRVQDLESWITARRAEVEAQARERAARIEREAFEQGFQQGERAGLEQGKKKLEPVLRNFMGLVQELSRLREELITGAEEDLLDLALAIAAKVIVSEVTQHPEVLREIMRAAVRQAVDRGSLKIKVHPSDLAFAQECRPDLMGVMEGIRTVTFEPDESLLRGGCVVETKFGEVDARIESQLREIRRGLRGE
ncbi:MAG: hypothetical protein HYV08_06195 [Deltaproteobacteria bacterium]|nr:hypothetical protein [Deltaproteobacteria bacterium]